MRTMMFVALAACGTTGGNTVKFETVARGVAGANVFDNALGWHVVLDQAHVRVGAVYLNLAVPLSGSQDTSCILPGIYTAEELYPLDVDVLSTAPQPFPQVGTGTDDEARTGEVWLTGGDINAPDDPTVIAAVSGTASQGALTLPFSASVTISQSNRGIPPSDPALPSQHPICKQRIVTPIPIDVRPEDNGTLAVTIDASQWFANVDFSFLPPGGVFPDDNSNPASQNLFAGLRAATTTFQLTFEAP